MDEEGKELNEGRRRERKEEEVSSIWRCERKRRMKRKWMRMEDDFEVRKWRKERG